MAGERVTATVCAAVSKTHCPAAPHAAGSATAIEAIAGRYRTDVGAGRAARSRGDNQRWRAMYTGQGHRIGQQRLLAARLLQREALLT